MAVALVGILVITSQVGSRDFEITKRIPAEEIQSIEIINDLWDLHVKESTDNQVHVDIAGTQKDKKKAPVVVTRKENKLIIRQDKQIGGFFSAFTFHKEGTITVSIPRNTVERVTIVNNEGDIDVRALATHHLIVENQAGNAKFNRVEADSGNLKLTEGDLTVNNCSFDRIDVAAKGNDLYFRNLTSPVVNVYSNSGEIVLNGVEEQGEMRVETRSGDIQVNYQTAPSSLKVAVNNAKGDTTVHLANLFTTKKTDKDVNGAIGAGENLLYVKSHSGSIGIK